jgi:hypothetical protein
MRRMREGRVRPMGEEDDPSPFPLAPRAESFSEKIFFRTVQTVEFEQ